MIATIGRYWLPALVTVLAAYYVLLGAVVGGATGLVGIAGGILIGAGLAPRGRSRRLAGACLVAGAVPFAALTWWSVVAPLLALVTLVLGGVVVARAPTRRSPRPAAG